MTDQAQQALALYAGFLSLFFLILSLRVMLRRRATGIDLGTGQDPLLRRAVRAQANFCEYAPLALLLMVISASLGATAWLLHAAGAPLAVGRLIHAIGVSREREDYRFRKAGIVLSLIPMLLLGAALLARGFAS